MKTSSRHPLFGAVIAAFAAFTLAAVAEDAASVPAKPESSVTVAASSATTATVSSADTTVSAPAEAPTSSATASTASTAATSSPTTTATETPAASSSAAAVPTPTDTTSLRSLTEGTESETPRKPGRSLRRRHDGITIHGGDNNLITTLNDAHLPKGQTADAVIAVLGDANCEGDANGTVMAVLGDVRVTGSTKDSAVAVLGDVYVDTTVRDVVAVLGDIKLGPNAVVNGNVVSVGGTVTRDPASTVHGTIPQIGVPGFHRGSFSGLHAYLAQCVFKARPLAFGPNLGWAWCIALGFLLFYVLLGLVFRGGMERCMTTLETRPGGTILASLLTLLLVPVLIVLLCITVVGIAVVPFLGIALCVATLFGKAAVLAFFGTRITRLAGNGPFGHPAIGILLAGVLLLVLYTVPVLGFILYKTLGVLGLGLVVFTLLNSSRREKTARVAGASGTPPPAAAGFAATSVAAGSAGTTAPGMIGVTEATIPPVAPPIATGASVPPPVMPVTAALPRAGFWIRTAALLLDMILVAVALAMTSTIFPHWMHLGPGNALFPVLAIYAIVLWKIRGTTIGGIICGLRVVRTDNRPIDWATAVVRALSCFLSLVVVGLGFIWVAIDDEKQSWHDKIAGTTVVLTRGHSLV